MCIDFLIQHHPRRSHMLGPLLERVPSAYVVADPDPGEVASPWRCYRACLEAVHRDATHALVLQDDAVVCAGFETAVCGAVAVKPDRPIVFCHPGQPLENLHRLNHARDAGLPWAELASQRWVPVIALCWPVELIRPALEWIDAQDFPPLLRADDEIVGRALRHLGVWPIATVPSLVQHEDNVESLIGRKAWAGADPGRVAHFWIGEADATAIDWAR